MSELYHQGIKGMKWGIRRYQNEDGSLTEAGKERYRRREKKTEKYRNKESDVINRRLMDIEKSAGKNLKRSTSLEDLKARSEKIEFGRDICRKELDYLKNMTYEQMVSEKREIWANRIDKALNRLVKNRTVETFDEETLKTIRRVYNN